MKALIRRLYHTSRSIYISKSHKYTKHKKIHWSYKNKNFGDILNPILFELLTDGPVVPINSKYYKSRNYLMIGSILQYANSHSIVFGSGFISEDSVCKEKPCKVYAVRGKLTRNKLLEQDIACPEIYGDPALLMPYVYYPIVKKKYKLGIIPHYVDKNNNWLKSVNNNSDVLIIDLITDSPLNIINQILSCEQIASSSLHGLIIADAYKIPSVWIEFSNKISGGHFKFFDYYSSIENNIKNPLKINENINIDILIKNTSKKDLKIDFIKLIKNFPFNAKPKILKKINEMIQ